jgi:hypothetical protein
LLSASASASASVSVSGYFKLPAACAMRCAFLLFAVLMATQHPNAAMNQQNQ